MPVPELQEGTKLDAGKPRYDLLPIDALDELVEVLSFGCRKYDDRNWERGIKYSRVYGAALRHLTKFWVGKDTDEETGLSHLAHAMCCCMFLLSYQLRSMKKFDDRPICPRLASAEPAPASATASQS
jgi:hypothetical protein